MKTAQGVRYDSRSKKLDFNVNHTICLIRQRLLHACLMDEHQIITVVLKLSVIHLSLVYC